MTNVKVFEKVKDQRVKVMESKEYTYEIWKPYHLPIKSYDPF
jgi:hypothetical protein